MPAGLTLRSRVKFGFVTESQVLKLDRNALATSGLAVGTVTARAVEPGPGALAGITVDMDSDHTPPDDPDTNPLSAGRPVYNFYSVEVVERIGYDSFTPDNGVLIAKNKNGQGNTFVTPAGTNSKTGYGVFTWVIDAHPEDIRMLDFKRPNGEPVMRTVADYRQLNDALFHAGLNSGSQYEWEDTPNRLHFYIVDVRRDSRGILSYTIGVRNLDGAGSRKRGVSVTAKGCAFQLANTGEAAAAPFDRDIYRLSVSTEGRGWNAELQNALAALKADESAAVPVFITHASGSTRAARVTLKAVSESDPSKTASASCTP